MSKSQKVPQKLRRNERERRRVDQVNQGFTVLRDRVPKPDGSKQKLSKVETLREATRYIQLLYSMLEPAAGPFPSMPPCSSAPQTTQASGYLQYSAESPVFYTNQHVSPYYPTLYMNNVSPNSSSSYYGSESSFEESKPSSYGVSLN